MLQVRLQQDRRRHAIHDASPLASRDIGRDEQLLRRLRRQALIPRHDRYGKRLLETTREFTDRPGGGPFLPVQPEREAQQDLSDGMRLNEGPNMGDVFLQPLASKRLERLRGPAQLITQGHTDALGSVIERKNSRVPHQFTAAALIQPAQTPFPTPQGGPLDSSHQPAPSQVDLHRFRRPPWPSLSRDRLPSRVWTGPW